ncbi:MAG: YebC/PmpR family DNA-binding transcriptional regulator [Cyanobacteria bacterium P01_A01_bin.135]
MAGHSKWANIKRQKARVDAVKGKTFAKLSRQIIVAARSGIPDPDGNFQLRTAIEKAKAAGIPNDNIERAIAKGAGTFDDGAELEDIRYEGYGPGGVAVLIEALTDNRNRTAADLRSAFSKNGGNLGETGCVSWMFAQKGVAQIKGPLEEEALLLAASEAGAETYELAEIGDTAGAEVFTAVSDLEALVTALRSADFTVDQAELRWVYDNTMQIDDPDQAKALIRLLDALEDLDDVQDVTANFEISDQVLAESL